MNIDLKYIILILVSLIAACGCSDDYPDGRRPEQQKGLAIYVPAVADFNTRSESEDAAELKYTSLFFFAYPSDESKKPTIVPLTSENNELSFAGDYKHYYVDLAPDTYRFYLIANIYDTDADVTELPQKASDLEKEIYNLPETFACQIPESGLPMSASNTDFSVKNSEGVISSISADGYYYDGKGGSVYALMSFLFAKITLIPMDAFGNPEKISDLVFSNISETEPVFFKEGYPDYGAVDITLENEESADTPESISFYIPERYVTEANKLSQSKLEFNIGSKSVTLPLGEIENTEEETVVTAPALESLRKIVRGTHYTYTLTTLAEITLEVTDWTPDKIAAELNGPVYLHIEKQEYEVRAGEETAIWFSSDAENIRIKSPTYTPEGETTPLNLYNYSVDAANDTIRVWVNPEIKSSEYKNILNSIQNKEGKYDYFHIVAGNINKRIGVTPLKLDYYLNINPENLAIDVKLRLASGEYQGDIPVSIHTNYPFIRVSLADGWNSLPESEFGTGVEPQNYPLKIRETTYDSDNKPVFSTQITESVNPVVAVDNGLAYYSVSFRGLNSGYAVWKDERTLTLKVEGFMEENGTVEKTEFATIKIVPLILNYRIHFKADSNAENWESPHIYVYQCLEFPADYTAAAPGGGTLASKPVGYKQGINYFAALEYSFTGSIAYRGWDYPANYNLLYNSDGTMKTFNGPLPQDSEGFYLFGDPSINDSWNPDTPNEKNEQRYNFNMDFCKAYRAELKEKGYCSDCYDNMNRLWPGIRMMPESDGWYVFELTGIATPGKALIMFANAHEDPDKQFPGGNQVGIPLFDFPSKEGWFVYNGNVDDRVYNQFYPTKPVEKKFRIYWPISLGYYYVHLWIELGNNDIGITTWPGGDTKTYGDYYYCDFACYQPNSAELGYLINNNNGGLGDKYTKFGNFKLDSSTGYYCGYYKDGEIIPGVPAN